MRIAALHKTTLLDFPGKVSALIFTRGCNFHCPYCHNPDLLSPGEAGMPPEDVFNFLRRRKAVLEGVVISGGEPTLQPGIAEFCAAVKALDYAVKLDTNGSRPEALQRLLQANLLDYVALDVKADPRGYPSALCPAELADCLAESIALLRKSGVPHEYRVTCVYPFITPESFTAILDAAHGPGTPVYLQEARLDTTLSPRFFSCGAGRALTSAEMQALASMAAARGVPCHMR